MFCNYWSCVFPFDICPKTSRFLSVFVDCGHGSVYFPMSKSLPGVSMSFNMVAYRDTKFLGCSCWCFLFLQNFWKLRDLFEASHHGIIEGPENHRNVRRFESKTKKKAVVFAPGVPFAGLPVLKNLCTIHQMSEAPRTGRKPSQFLFNVLKPASGELFLCATETPAQWDYECRYSIQKRLGQMCGVKCAVFPL